MKILGVISLNATNHCNIRSYGRRIRLTKIAISEMYKSVFEEVNENQAHYKAKLSVLKEKLENAEENLVTVCIDRTMFDKDKAKFNQEISKIEKELVKNRQRKFTPAKVLGFRC